MDAESVLPEEQMVSEILWRLGEQVGPYRELHERSESPSIKFIQNDKIWNAIPFPLLSKSAKSYIS
ncbi:Uncharacterized protein APZ42_030359 [Daphnia magna]|uniref:Uncharacterized protein n=1 Tax=Daphnia magna TaxID=35525 RepID=A0A164NUD3_9CRUS|nr:Uncharacterized protein APZ42_030359 [Daphnia magna]